MRKGKSQPNQSKEMINYHRLANMGQLMMKINEQLDILLELALATEEEKAAMRKNLEEYNEQSRKQGNKTRGDSPSDLEPSGEPSES